MRHLVLLAMVVSMADAAVGCKSGVVVDVAEPFPCIDGLTCDARAEFCLVKDDDGDDEYAISATCEPLPVPPNVGADFDGDCECGSEELSNPGPGTMCWCHVP